MPVAACAHVNPSAHALRQLDFADLAAALQLRSQTALVSCNSHNFHRLERPPVSPWRYLDRHLDVTGTWP
jgi:hypothetical protein